MKLGEYLQENRIPAAKFARLVGVHRATIFRWCLLERIPDIPMMIKIRELTSGAVSAFDDWLSDGREGCRTR